MRALDVCRRALGDPVDAERDLAQHTLTGDVHPTLLAVEYEGHGDDRLQRVALRAPVGGDVCLPRRHADGEVEQAIHDVRRDAGAVVRDRDRVRIDGDRDLRRDALFLAGVQCVVDQLLDGDERPVLGAVAALERQLLLGDEVEQSAGRERRPLQTLVAHRQRPGHGCSSRVGVTSS
jgi:hypothetical protein